MPMALQKIAEQNERVGAIIHRLREFVRKGTPTTKSEALADIVDDAIALVSISPLAKGVRLTTRLADDATCVSVDRIQIQQVLFNLMRNAIEAMEGRRSGR